MPGKILTEVGNHLVEVLAGLTLVVLGVSLAVTAALPSGQPWQLYLGSFGTAFGGAALSWTVGKAVSKEEALREVRSQLGLVSRTLGQAAGQINRVVDQCSERSLPAETGFAMVGQSAMLVGAQVSAIQDILGDPIEYGDLLSTISEMEHLAEQLDRKGRREDVGEVKSRLKEMRAELEGSGRGAARRMDMVSCPYCSSENEVSLGVYPGDTAQSRCRKCARGFNSHRRSDGTAFARPLSTNGNQTSTSAADEVVRYLTAQCPSCHEALRVRQGNEGDKLVVCTKCGAGLTVEADTGSIVKTSSFEKHPGVVTGRYGSGGTGARPIVTCQLCQKPIRCIIRQPDASFGLDTDCMRLYEVKNEELRAWRMKNEPETLPADITQGGEDDRGPREATGVMVQRTTETVAVLTEA